MRIDLNNKDILNPLIEIQFDDKTEYSNVIKNLSCKHKEVFDELKVIIPYYFLNVMRNDLHEFKDNIKVSEKFIIWAKQNCEKIPNVVNIHCKPIKSRIIGHFPIMEVTKACRFFSNAAINSKAFKSGRWDGYINLFDKKTNLFPTGLLSKVIDILERHRIPYNVQYLYDTNPKREYDWRPKDLFELSEDQIEAIESCMKAGRCCCKAATGFGKTSALARYLTAYHGVPTLFIANKKVLLDDAANDFIEGIDGLEKEDVAQIKEGYFGDVKVVSTTKAEDVPPLNKPVVVATIKSLSARMKDPRTREHLIYWLRNVCKFLMVDETQAVGTAMWDTVLKEVYAPYRVFLSATPRRTDGATLKIFAFSGPLVFDTTAEEQIEKGRLCELNIDYVVFDHHLFNENDKNIEYNEAYCACVVTNKKRNKLIVEKALDMIKDERQVLILVQQIEHGHLIKEALLEAGLDVDDVKFIWGETSNKKRQDTIDSFRKNGFKVLIGSTIADAGLNIKTISGVILAGAGNSDITLIQRIGRGTRNCDYEKEIGYQPKFIKDNNGVKVTEVVDIIDDNVIFFKKQAKNRYNNAVEEFGADRVHIVGDDNFTFNRRSKVKKQDLKEVDELKSKLSMFREFDKISKSDKKGDVALDDDVKNLINIFSNK